MGRHRRGGMRSLRGARTPLGTSLLVAASSAALAAAVVQLGPGWGDAPRGPDRTTSAGAEQVVAVTGRTSGPSRTQQLDRPDVGDAEVTARGGSSVPFAGSGRLQTVPATSRAVPAGAMTYRVRIEREVPVDAADTAEAIDETLHDERSWFGSGRRGLVRVDSEDPDFTVLIATPATTDRLCLPLDTGGRLSCRSGDRAVINARRWTSGATTYRGHLAEYREYVVNHEVGHLLGRGHDGCPVKGRLASVMTQQTKSLLGCTRNPWPFPTGGS